MAGGSVFPAQIAECEKAVPLEFIFMPYQTQGALQFAVCQWDFKKPACGVCSTGKCPFGAVAKHDKEVYKIFVGGTWGKKTRMGTALSRFVEKEEIFPLLEKTMLWFKENAYQKERLGAAIDRIGVDKMEEALFGDDLLNRKEEILAAPVKERA